MISLLLVWSLWAAPVAAQPDPATGNAELKRGRQLANKGQHKEAVVALDAALKALPDDPRILLELGVELRAAGDLVRAETICKQATTKSNEPNDEAKAYYNLGRVLEDKPDQPGAITAYRASIKLRENATVRARLVALGGTADRGGTPPPKSDDRCAEACTSIAVCWEEVNGGDYRGGMVCTRRCDERTDKGQFLRCVTRAKNCKVMLGCE